VRWPKCHRGAAATCLPCGSHHRPGYVQAAGSTGRTQPAAPPGRVAKGPGRVGPWPVACGPVVGWTGCYERAPGRRGVTGPGPRTA
jgi:hypothetical protein